MGTNKTGKYFKYAIGEIILVMIGILLALSINNWNEERKSSKKEIAKLKSLKSEMITSLKELKSDYKMSNIFLQSTENIYSYIQVKPQPVDSMYRDFYNSIRFDHFFPKTSTYETLKSGNLELIKSDSIRMLITDVHETGFQRILRKINTRRNAASLLFPYYQKHFRTKYVKKDTLSWNKILGIPNDYNSLINDAEYETLISEALYGRAMAKGDLESTIKSVENCINQIDIYLTKKSK